MTRTADKSAIAVFVSNDLKQLRSAVAKGRHRNCVTKYHTAASGATTTTTISSQNEMSETKIFTYEEMR